MPKRILTVPDLLVSDPLAGASLTPSELQAIHDDLSQLKANLNQAIQGKPEVIDYVITTLLAGGHLLIEDVPGVGKTTLAMALAQSIGGVHQRIQFTSDLLPSDVIGVPIFNQSEHRFEFKHGPIFANIVLADEINRTTPKTQSCMLEAMQDAKVSIDRQVYELPQPFMVIATQNPIEHHGTYPLPESQLDRFMMRIEMGYPNLENELSILRDLQNSRDSQPLAAVCSTARVLALQQAAQRVQMDESLAHYLLKIVHATRTHADLELGVSTRGSLMLKRAAQAYALSRGRTYCIPDDIKKLVQPVFAHRLLTRATFRSSLPAQETKSSAALLLERLLTEIEVPV